MRGPDRPPPHAGATKAVEVLVADMSVGYKAIHETFTSRVELDPPRRKILVEYIDGPFRHLENRWTFRDEPEGGSDGRSSTSPTSSAAARSAC